MKKENIMLKLNSSFQRGIFQKLIDKYCGSIKASRIIKIPAASIRGYKNLYFDSVPDFLIKRLIKLKIINIDNLKRNTLSTFNKDDKIKENLDRGRKKIKEKFRQFKKDMPPINEVLTSNKLFFSKWFNKYKNLLDIPFRNLRIGNERDNLILNYSNFTKQGFKNFKIKIPEKFTLDDDFVYFFGLWCGDRAGGKRFGICNKNPEIIKFAENFLIRLHQKTEKILYITENMPTPNIQFDKKFIIKKPIKGWVLSAHSTNGVLASFFHYLLSNLEEFLNTIKNKKAFFAGLFDAEGNVSLYNKSFRWACKKKDLIKIYSNFLKKLDLYDKYDGACLISYNKKGFYDNIYPFLKHSQKKNSSLILCKAKGRLPSDHLDVLQYVKNNPGSTSKQIAKALKKTKVYSELKILHDFALITNEDYPLKFKVTNMGLKSLGG